MSGVIQDFRVAVATDLTDLSAHYRGEVIARLAPWKPRLAATQGRIVIGMTVRANGVQQAEKQARAVVADLLRDMLAAGTVTGVQVAAR